MCAKTCGDKIQYANGQLGNPCQGAEKIRHIDPNENLNGGGQGAFECTWNSINETTLQAMYNEAKYTNSVIADKGSVYEQLLFGVRVGGYNTEGQGFCENTANLQKEVGGGTCYDKLAERVSETTLRQRGIEYCNIAANKTDPKCKCINVSGSGFAERCKSNPSWSGCDEINTAAAGYESVGVLQTLTGLTGGADCLVPGICSGSVYTPIETPQACANQIAICDQVQKIDVGKLEEAAQLRAFQSCNINFSGPPGTSPTSPTSPIVSLLPPSVSTFIPVSLNDLQTDRNKQYGAGGISFVSFASMCVIVIIIVVLSSGGGGGPSGPTRFRRR